MTCSKCNNQIPDTAKFCVHCGTAVGSTTCPTCQTTLRAGARFCARCGASLAQLPGQQTMTVAATPPKKSRLRPAWRATLLPVIIIPALVGVFLLLTHNKEKPKSLATSGEQRSGAEPGGESMQGGGMDKVFQQINNFKSALQNNPRDTTALAGLGQLYELAAKFPEAADYYRRYLEVSPDNAEVRMSLAGVYFNQQDFSRAETEIKEVLRRRPDYDFALYNLAVIYAADLKKDEAIKVWHRVMELSPGSELAQKSANSIKSMSQ